MEYHLVIDPASYDVVLAHNPAPDALATFHYDAWTSVVPEGAPVEGEMQRQPGWRHITIEADLPFDTVGFFRRFADALADAKIPILPFASYRFDHVLVPATRVEEAMDVMASLT